MKKVTVLIDQFHQHGGIEKLVGIKANYWSRVFNYNVTVLSTEQKEKAHVYSINKAVKFIDLKINYNRLKSYFSLSNIALLILNIYKIQKYILKEKPEFIVVASHIPITYILPFLIKPTTKIIKEFHFTRFYDSVNRNGFKNKVLNFIESKYDTLVVLSREERTFYNSKNTEIIANPVIDNPELSINLDAEKELIACAVVRSAPVKRLELLVEIWELFSRKNPNWKLYIYGELEDAYGSKIKNLVKNKRLNEQVIFKGNSSNIQEELSKTKVLLLTSEQECFPMVILEANSVGVPVISFDCPTGPRNIINDNIDGLLVENNNVAKFVDVLEGFSTNEQIQNKLKINALLNVKKYNLEHIMNLWNSIIFKN